MSPILAAHASLSRSIPAQPLHPALNALDLSFLWSWAFGAFLLLALLFQISTPFRRPPCQAGTVLFCFSVVNGEAPEALQN